MTVLIGAQGQPPKTLIRQNFRQLALNPTVAALAVHIGVSRQTLSKVVNERGSISPDMARSLVSLGKSYHFLFLMQKILLFFH
ncbi:MAG: hypothetical protein FWG62_01620 [Proteobacteria bacterium]|nr:hypothetical protein [Pseudomonadota bacterium]